jgi:hypothetical protein
LSVIEDLASYRRTVQKIRSNWPAFLQKRSQRLAQHERHGAAAEKVAENILEDLLTMVLDWSLSDINNQIGYADLLLTRLGIKHIIIEVKRPGALAWNRRAVEAALDQAHQYADEQKVSCVGVSDGIMLYAADIQHGGLQDRVFVALDSPDPQESLWWLSEHGIYRSRDEREDAVLRLPPETKTTERAAVASQDYILLHPKYKVPARCFAYVGNAADPKTWKLPYRLSDGSIDAKRLPKAIQSILSNYRGVKVSGINERDVPDVLVRLACAAAYLGKMPHQVGNPSAVYVQLAGVLDQLGRSEEIVLA